MSECHGQCARSRAEEAYRFRLDGHDRRKLVLIP